VALGSDFKGKISMLRYTAAGDLDRRRRRTGEA
jgi:hypothetical protein